jgi:hypothetical protein
VRGMQEVPLFSQNRHMLRSDGAPNRAFFYGLFRDHAMAIEFLKDIGLIQRTIQCNSAYRYVPVALSFITKRSFLSDHFWVRVSAIFKKPTPKGFF